MAVDRKLRAIGEKLREDVEREKGCRGLRG
jgi:hypothetical protein